MRAIEVYIFKHSLFVGCSNGGISRQYDKILLICNEGNIEIPSGDYPENLCKIVTRNLIGCEGPYEHKHIEPYCLPDKDCAGWMMGGSYISSSDTKFSRISQYPLPFHDRQEKLLN